MNEIQKDALADAMSMLDSVTWTLEDRADEKNLLAIVSSIQERLDTIAEQG